MEKITIDRDELNTLIADGIKKGLEGMAEQGSTTRVLRRVTDRKVEVRLIDNRVVLGFKNRGSENRPVYIYEKPDPKDPKQNLAYVDLILEGMTNEEKFEVDFKQFRAESARAICKVTKTEEKEWMINQGTVKKKEVEEYSSIELDFDVPVDIVGKSRFFTVELPKEFGGPRQVTISEQYVNIA